MDKEKGTAPSSGHRSNKKIKAILNGKSKAAAWFVSRCISSGRRENFVKKLKPELYKLNLTLDVYGRCGNLKCPRTKEGRCYDMVKKDYYFHLSFENSLSTDYVTEKLLTALNNFAIPVVYGGADYSRPSHILYPRRLAPDKLKIAREEFQAMLAIGTVRPSESPWSSALHLAPKKDNDHLSTSRQLLERAQAWSKAACDDYERDNGRQNQVP
ncbi:3-galactosyl-N-acetylglucosaminide 4-alpha-L-fucosyltransferase FUT3-like [Plodia interpunctella]|uniref:3-galactosyl-N-acetylglucosaminide 4-alpha-L-fucosyltransferase FUT3-like n=1 Tax=Plodia interpunctella TaxID=58824 RepID=UPI0023679F74|nr:3-galactosyl-N-acetylglucosaminide 4-alpha-L-fucosyltransferase FUT3-like [Plodia interpunctella]